MMNDFIRLILEIATILLTGSGIYWNIRIKLKELEMRISSVETMEKKFSEDFTKLEDKLDILVTRIEGVATKLEVMTEKVNNILRK